MSSLGVTRDMVWASMADVIVERNNASGTTSFVNGIDTTFIKLVMDKLVDQVSTPWTSAQQSSLVGIVSAYVNSMYESGDMNTFDQLFSGVFSAQIESDITACLNDPAACANDGILNAYFDDALARAGVTNITNENKNFVDTTVYNVSAVGSDYYEVDGVNADSTPLVIYARVGDVLNFSPTANSVFVTHPFELSTSQNDTAGVNNIGINEGWDQSTHTLTVNANTPSVIYPHCGVHSGMYTNGSIQIVENFDLANIDLTNQTSALQVKGTVSAGPFLGAMGYTYDVYLSSQGGNEHTHVFHQYPGLTFYMPAGQGYHGSKSPSDSVQKFKPKSHFSENSGDAGSGGTY